MKTVVRRLDFAEKILRNTIKKFRYC